MSMRTDIPWRLSLTQCTIFHDFSLINTSLWSCFLFNFVAFSQYLNFPFFRFVKYSYIKPNLPYCIFYLVLKSLFLSIEKSKRLQRCDWLLHTAHSKWWLLFFHQTKSQFQFNAPFYDQNSPVCCAFFDEVLFSKPIFVYMAWKDGGTRGNIRWWTQREGSNGSETLL